MIESCDHKESASVGDVLFFCESFPHKAVDAGRVDVGIAIGGGTDIRVTGEAITE